MLIIELLKAVLFGIVEGITEWLPISSTGHMILLNEFLSLDVSPAFWELFEVVIQLGAILAVIVLFFRKLNPLSPSKEAKEKAATWRLWGLVIIAVLPSAVIGLLLDDWLNEHFYNYVTVAAALIVYGIAFIVIERLRKDTAPRVETVEQLTVRDALTVGIFQVLAVIPGTSRSGSTILGGMLTGVARPAGAEFSFFLAIPVMLGASALKILKYVLDFGLAFTLQELTLLLVGIVVAFLVSLCAIRFLVSFVRRHSFAVFGWYRIALGVVVLGVNLLLS